MSGVVDPFIGMRLADRYELEECIGAGGMGTVYRARDCVLARAVAVKLLSLRRSSDPDWTARLRAEAQVLARLIHPSTVRVYDFGTFSAGELEELPFLVMELLGGRTLEQELQHNGTLPPRRALDILVKLCGSLEEAHQAGIVHGDVKPSNVFLIGSDGGPDFVKLIDFSVARSATDTGADDRQVGTPAYMHPRLAGMAGSPAADIYACGVTTYRMLIGQIPSLGRSESIRMLLALAPDPVAAIVLRALETYAFTMYPAITELRHDCEQVLAASDLPTSWDSSAAEHLSLHRRHGWVDPPAGLRHRLAINIDDAHILAWSPGGRWLAIAAHSGLHVLELATGQISALPFRWISSMSWMDGRSEILVGCDIGVVAVDVERGVLNNLAMGNLREEERVTRTACSPDGLFVAIATSTQGNAESELIILDRQTMSAGVRMPSGRGISDLDWSPRGGLLAVGMYGGVATVIDGRTGQIIQSLDLASSSTPDAASSAASASRRGPSFVSWARDGTMLAGSYLPFHNHISEATWFWSTRDWKPLARLDTSVQHGASFSAIGPLFAASGSGLTIWRHDRFNAVAKLPLSFDRTMILGYDDMVSFHPELPILAAADMHGVYLWDIDVNTLLDASREVTVHYSNAKVVIVGDSGVGKSALGLVLTGEQFRATDSTHGRHIWTLHSEGVPLSDVAQLHREVLLWDLAGQPGYRAFHRQHLDEASVALVLYDARSETDPFAGVSYWARALDDATRGFPITKFLVAARIDRGGTAVSDVRVREIAERHGFSRCFETSARRGDGVTELSEAIRVAIAWDRLPRVSALKLFYDMKSFVLAEKLGGRVIQRRGELRERFCALANEEVSPAAFDVCVGQLEAAGLVKRLSFGDLVLLQPEMLDAYSAWMALAARQEPEGLGFLPERAARTGDFAMDSDRPLGGRGEEVLLLTATVEDVVGRGIALRQPTERGEMLVFPSELREDMPDDVPDHVRTMIFHFDGPVKAVYATLAVCLAHAPAFTRQRFYRDAAVFRSPSSEVCGFRMDYPRVSDDAHGRLTVFFDAGTSDTTKRTFLRYVNHQLELMAFSGSVQRERVYQCSCGYPEPIPRSAVEWRLKRGETTAICNVCGRHIPLDSLAEQTTHLDRVVEHQIAESDAERERQRRLSVLSERERGGEYDVFLSYNSQDRTEVIQLAQRLRDHGVLPWFDRDELLPGTRFVPELERMLERIPCAAVIVGPHAFGPWHEHEYYTVIQRELERRHDGRRRLRVIPVLLPGAVEPPPFLRGLVRADFRAAGDGTDREEFKKLVQAILTVRAPERTDAV
jgi:small GTP-binding protein